ncbi:MAG: hypothetical protein V7641_4375, partial [Blastocatellia bacterium]
AVEVVMAALRQNPQPKYRKPAYPNFYTNAGRAVPAPTARAKTTKRAPASKAN